MWAAGVMMYELVVGRHPFYERGDSKRDIEKKISNYAGFTYPKHVSKQARHMIDSLCRSSLNQRYKACNTLSHPWITRNFNDSFPLTDQERYQLSLENIATE